MTDLVLVMTTMPDDHRAEELARTLVDERLAACVTVGAPMLSTYRWQDQIETAAERQLTIKTVRGRLPELERRVLELHPYDVPDWVTLDAVAGDAYAAWVAGQCATLTP